MLRSRSCLVFVGVFFPHTIRGYGRKIFLHFDVWKSAIVQMYSQTRRGNGARREKKTDRLEDHLMLRVQENVVLKKPQEFETLLACCQLIAQRAQELEFIRRFRYAIHECFEGQGVRPWCGFGCENSIRSSPPR